MKNKLDETKPGERPDTIYLAKVPVKWFNVSFVSLRLNAIFRMENLMVHVKYFFRKLCPFSGQLDELIYRVVIL